MPRQARLEAAGVLHHFRVRGLEQRAIFADDTDRADFLAHLAALGRATGLAVCVWALLPNHAHLLVWTGNRPLPLRPAGAPGESHAAQRDPDELRL